MPIDPAALREMADRIQAFIDASVESVTMTSGSIMTALDPEVAELQSWADEAEAEPDPEPEPDPETGHKRTHHKAPAKRS